MAYWDHQMYSMTSLPLLHMLGTSQTWQALWFAFLVIFVSNLFSSSSLPLQSVLFTSCMPSTTISAKTLALDPLVSLLLIFHVLCCLPPCDSDNQLFAYYSISYDSNRVQIHSLNAACPRVSLVSSYTKFCASYTNPPCLRRILPTWYLYSLPPLLTDAYTTYLVDIMMLITM